MGSSGSQCCSIVSAGKENVVLQGALPKNSNRLAQMVNSTLDSAEKASGKGRRMAVPRDESSLEELRTFSAFLKEYYLSPGDAFDEMFKNLSSDEFGSMFKTQRVDRHMFQQRCASAGFKGRAGLVFDLLKDTDEYLTRACFKFRLGTSNLSPGLGKTDKDTTWKLATDGQSSSESSKTADARDSLKKTDGHEDEEECKSLGSASTADTSSPPKELDTSRKSRRLGDGQDTELAVPHQSPRKSRRTGGMLGPPPAGGTPRKSGKHCSDVVEPSTLNNPPTVKARKSRSVTKTR